MGLRIGGKIVDGPKKGLIVLPRVDGDIAFHFVAVLDDHEFEMICPPPKPPVSIKTGVGRVENTDDARYKEKLVNRIKQRQHWMFLKSVEPSNIEWTKVKISNPDTYPLWEEELKEAGFNMYERQAIYLEFMKTNMLTDDMLDEARARFLASQLPEIPEDLLFQKDEPKTTPSGVPVNVSEFVPLG